MFISMRYVKPIYSNAAVDRASAELVRSPKGSNEYRSSLEIVNQWRSSHLWPLQKIQHTLRNRARSVDSKAIVVQRLKRLHSIEGKLERLPGTRLSGMHDIGGCRAIVKDVNCVNDLVDKYVVASERNPTGRSILTRPATDYDYIANPQQSGYRGIHLILKYQSDGSETRAWNGRKVEIQIRTKLQHAWATSLETISTLRQENLKAGIGNPEWLRFFELSGGIFAEVEDCNPVPDIPVGESLYRETAHLWEKLNVNTMLLGASIVGVDLGSVVAKDAFYVMRLDSHERAVYTTGYRQTEILKAIENYAKLELEYSGKPSVDIVLVRADDLKQLKLAYPNYFADTRFFASRLAIEVESRLGIQLAG